MAAGRTGAPALRLLPDPDISSVPRGG